MGWNAAGGATSNYIKGDDPLAGAGWGATGSAFDYGVGKYLIKTPLDVLRNPTWKNYEWVDIGMGISQPMQLSPLPGIAGNSGAALATESGIQGGPKLLDMLNGD